MSRTRPIALALALMLAVCAAGCGSSGGGGAAPADDSLLTGSYFLIAMGAMDDTPDVGSAAWAVTALDGMGGLTGTLGTNTAGVVSGPGPLAGTYSVAADRTTAFDFGASGGYLGFSNVGGTVALAGNISLTGVPAMLGLVELGAGFATADLQGDWFVGSLWVDTSGLVSVYWGTATFGAAGSGSMTVSHNLEGTIFTGPPIALAANVAGNGQVTIASGGATVEGALDASKDLLVATGSTATTEDPLCIFLVRKTAGASAATLIGNYHIIGLERDGGGGFASITGSVVSNGAGGITAAFTKNLDGTITNEGPEVVSYTAGADGALVVDPAGDPLVGGFSDGGAYAVIGGPNASATNPRLYLLMSR